MFNKRGLSIQMVVVIIIFSGISLVVLLGITGLLGDKLFGIGRLIRNLLGIG